MGCNNQFALQKSWLAHVSKGDRFLATAGTDKTKLLSANIWITEMANFRDERGLGQLGLSRKYASAGDRRGEAGIDYKVEIMVVAAR
jgi:enamine deaminase RidA (YjgF/YER057c/UK114 family)